ncbi:hypothetical protein EV193_11620 [Herbihabitans rhizosphaerae]|uniref:Uncharacterized protein n=1 Tax=Herbihabitans rhizosphaerae TaxID=1872711 RepID=A0A4Q7KEM6_9PSEU|nr:hypothetical protein EV193_11620 [Herbihabitans rhizosphaerae]
MQAADQLAGVDVEGGGDFEDVVEGEVALSAFDLAEEAPVQTGVFGEAFLG